MTNIQIWPDMVKDYNFVFFTFWTIPLKHFEKLLSLKKHVAAWLASEKMVGLYTVHCAQCTVYSAQCTVHCALCRASEATTTNSFKANYEGFPKHGKECIWASGGFFLCSSFEYAQNLEGGRLNAAETPCFPSHFMHCMGLGRTRALAWGETYMRHHKVRYHTTQQCGGKEVSLGVNLTLYLIVLQYCRFLAVDIKQWQFLRCSMWAHLGIIPSNKNLKIFQARINRVNIPWEEFLGFPINSKIIPISGIFASLFPIGFYQEMHVFKFILFLLVSPCFLFEDSIYLIFVALV